MLVPELEIVAQLSANAYTYTHEAKLGGETKRGTNLDQATLSKLSLALVLSHSLYLRR